MFKSVLIANRGEIAVRVIRACKELGIRTIAIYSEADRAAMHTRYADEAYCVGGAPARESYLAIDSVLAIATQHGAEAIHPGYGFLSENADFAEACAQAGIVFIGPTPEAIRTMGSKTAAKRAVEARGVPTVPGFAGAAADTPAFMREADRLGYPLMIKAAAGGGGKGMRAVMEAASFPESLGAAQREALAAFGDSSVFLERLLVAPRHVEFQILADTYGATIHLGERECSIQRRHQKVIEESPSVALTPALRAAMGAAAVQAAQAVGYTNAGTCEFLLDASGSFYFLEMNTRLQVEHPVTELVTGVDLVRHQLAIAAGERLTLRQEDIIPRGHAIEARLYAEDPFNGYLPSTGRISAFSPPYGPGVRVDAGVETGDEVSMYYDPMLAKLIIYGETRAAAIERLTHALADFDVLGVATNSALLKGIAAEPAFLQGKTSTAFIETHALVPDTPPAPPTDVLVAAALWETLQAPSTVGETGSYNPWLATAGAERGSGPQHYRYQALGGAARVTLQSTGNAYVMSVVTPDQQEPNHLTVSAWLGADNQLFVDDAGRRRRYVVARRGLDVLVSSAGVGYTLAKPRPLDVESTAHVHVAARGVKALVAPMAGTIIKVNVREGDQVRDRQTLVVLGAMKMEHAIIAPYAGLVRSVPYNAGDVVAGGATLVEIEATPDA